MATLCGSHLPIDKPCQKRDRVFIKAGFDRRRRDCKSWGLINPKYSARGLLKALESNEL